MSLKNTKSFLERFLKIYGYVKADWVHQIFLPSAGVSSCSSIRTLPDRNCPGKYSRDVLSNKMRNFKSFLGIFEIWIISFRNTQHSLTSRHHRTTTLPSNFHHRLKWWGYLKVPYHVVYLRSRTHQYGTNKSTNWWCAPLL